MKADIVAGDYDKWQYMDVHTTMTSEPVSHVVLTMKHYQAILWQDGRYCLPRNKAAIRDKLAAKVTEWNIIHEAHKDTFIIAGLQTDTEPNTVNLFAVSSFTRRQGQTSIDTQGLKRPHIGRMITLRSGTGWSVVLAVSAHRCVHILAVEGLKISVVSSNYDVGDYDICTSTLIDGIVQIGCYGELVSLKLKVK